MFYKNAETSQARFSILKKSISIAFKIKVNAGQSKEAAV